MKTRLILHLTVVLSSACCGTSCTALQQPGNCFGPPSQAQLDQQATLSAQLLKKS